MSSAELLRLVIEEVRVAGWDVEIRLRIPLDEGPHDFYLRRTQVGMAGRRRCQAMTGCVPSVVLRGDSYRLKGKGEEVTGPPKAH